ncbi:IclR family transcriptional regulator, partial [Candidatus Aerophobetes bacterium]
QEEGLERFTENTITDPEVLKQELKEIRKRGYAIDNMEHEEGIRCVGAPIRNHRGEVFAAISVSGPSQRFSLSRIEVMAKLVIKAAKEISKKMGYREG